MKALPLTGALCSLLGQTTCLWLYSCTIECILLFFFFYKDCANEIQGQFKLGEARRKRKQFACSQTTRLCPGVYLPLLRSWPFLGFLECQGETRLSILSCFNSGNGYKDNSWLSVLETDCLDLSEVGLIDIPHIFKKFNGQNLYWVVSSH